MEGEDEQSIETDKRRTDRRNGGGHAPVGGSICGRQTRTRGRSTDASWEWSRAGSEWAWSRVQRDTTLGLDRNESRHFGVSAARLTHSSRTGSPWPPAPPH